MKAIKFKKEIKCYKLQDKECKQIKIPADEEKNITHEVNLVVCKCNQGSSCNPFQCSKLFISLQMDTCHNSLMQYPFREQRFSADRLQRELVI